MRLRLFVRPVPAALPSLALLALALAVSLPAVARAQVDSREGIYLQNQIQELKHDIQVLREQGGQSGSAGGGSMLGGARGGAPAAVGSGDLATSLLDRVSRLEDEVRSLRGKIDELNNSQKQMNDDLSKRIDDLNFKIDNPSAAPPAPVPMPAAGKGAPIPLVTTPAPKRTPEMAMQDGNAALARRDYATAETAAREVIASKSPRAYDAQFLLAQALAGKKDYQGAAVAYDDAYNRARTGNHAQDSLLGLANSLIDIGEKRAACATLDKLRTEFPTPRNDLKQPITRARTAAGCH